MADKIQSAPDDCTQEYGIQEHVDGVWENIASSKCDKESVLARLVTLRSRSGQYDYRLIAKTCQVVDESTLS